MTLQAVIGQQYHHIRYLGVKANLQWFGASEMASLSEELADVSKPQRPFIQPHYLLPIWHNRIDAIEVGD